MKRALFAAAIAAFLGAPAAAAPTPALQDPPGTIDFGIETPSRDADETFAARDAGGPLRGGSLRERPRPEHGVGGL